MTELSKGQRRRRNKAIRRKERTERNKRSQEEARELKKAQGYVFKVDCQPGDLYTEDQTVELESHIRSRLNEGDFLLSFRRIRPRLRDLILKGIYEWNQLRDLIEIYRVYCQMGESGIDLMKKIMGRE